MPELVTVSAVWFYRGDKERRHPAVANRCGVIGNHDELSGFIAALRRDLEGDGHAVIRDLVVSFVPRDVYVGLCADD